MMINKVAQYAVKIIGRMNDLNEKIIKVLKPINNKKFFNHFGYHYNLHNLQPYVLFLPTIISCTVRGNRFKTRNITKKSMR